MGSKIVVFNINCSPCTHESGKVNLTSLSLLVFVADVDHCAINNTKQ